MPITCRLLVAVRVRVVHVSIVETEAVWLEARAGRVYTSRLPRRYLSQLTCLSQGKELALPTRRR